MSDLRQALEPSALSPDWSVGCAPAWESEIEASKAISLKRIADALDGNVDTSVHGLLYQIAMQGSRHDQ